MFALCYIRKSLCSQLDGETSEEDLSPNLSMKVYSLLVFFHGCLPLTVFALVVYHFLISAMVIACILCQFPGILKLCPRYCA